MVYKQKSKVMSNPIISLAALAVIALVVMVGFSLGPFAASTVAPADKVPLLPDEAAMFCPDFTPDVNVKTHDLENVGTNIAEAESIYSEKGSNVWTQFTTGTAIADLTAYTTYEFIVGVDVDNWVDNAYGPVGEFTVKCQPDETIYLGIYNDEEEGSVTGTFFNRDDNAAAQAIAADQSRTVRIRLTAGTDEVYGNPFIATSGLGDIGIHRVEYPNMMALKINTTHGDKPDWVKIESNMEEMKIIPCGTLITAATGFDYYCYECPVLTDEDVNVLISYNSDNSYDPTADDTAYFYASNFYVDSDDGIKKWGNENEDNAALGASDAIAVTIDLS